MHVKIRHDAPQSHGTANALCFEGYGWVRYKEEMNRNTQQEPLEEKSQSSLDGQRNWELPSAFPAT